jgi:hypothetical protein
VTKRKGIKKKQIRKKAKKNIRIMDNKGKRGKSLIKIKNKLTTVCF